MYEVPTLTALTQSRGGRREMDGNERERREPGTALCLHVTHPHVDINGAIELLDGSHHIISLTLGDGRPHGRLRICREHSEAVTNLTPVLSYSTKYHRSVMGMQAPAQERIVAVLRRQTVR